MPDTRPNNPHPRNRFRYRGVASSCAAFVALTAAGVAVPSAAHAEPASCSPATATTFAGPDIPFVDWAENLGYDAQGNLWVSRLYRNVVQRYDSAGRITATVPVTSPGAIRLGPDHLLYVVYGDTTMNMLPGTHNSGVVRFDPAAAAPVPEVFVNGLGMANGAAFDAAGNLYIADTTSGVVRVRTDGTIDTDWTAQAKTFGVNGIAVEGDSVYTTVYLSPQGRILRIPIDAPTRRSTVAAMALADDLTAGPGGFLYVATTAGALIRVDRDSHSTCTVLTDSPMAAVVPVPGADDDLMVATGRGDVLRVHLG